jgi:hypothetical protein
MRSQIIFELVICNLHTKKIKTSLQKKKKKKKIKTLICCTQKIKNKIKKQKQNLILFVGIESKNIFD